uniref:Kazal-like domain-containing protein n=1 Tax=Homalodisca liturata TaxID=320908 RepID=A0A1B6I1E3_9HEMI
MKILMILCVTVYFEVCNEQHFCDATYPCRCGDECCRISICEKIYDPVCAYNNCSGACVTYGNECFLQKAQKCDDGDYILAYKGFCLPGGKTCEETGLMCGKICPQVCTLIYDPVCGCSPTKGCKMFSNECWLRSTNLCDGGDYVRTCDECCNEDRCPGDACSAQCPSFCPVLKFEPVCGYNKAKGCVTFRNECFMNEAKRCDGYNFTLAYKGPCQPCGETCLEKGVVCGKRCPLDCDDNSNEPVCGYSYTKGCKTFANKCKFEEENYCNGGDYTLNCRKKCRCEAEYEGEDDDCSELVILM